jgi:hypothetical protein
VWEFVCSGVLDLLGEKTFMSPPFPPLRVVLHAAAADLRPLAPHATRPAGGSAWRGTDAGGRGAALAGRASPNRTAVHPLLRGRAVALAEALEVAPREARELGREQCLRRWELLGAREQRHQQKGERTDGKVTKKKEIEKKKKTNFLDLGSNQGPPDLQSGALPTELSRMIVGWGSA